jgi:tetratricopeptide (TPR) repeat protein
MPFLPRRRRPRPRQMLARANRLFGRGEYAEAAPIFDRLAKGAAERGMLNRAGDLYLQSARCYLGMGKAALAVERGKHALRLFGRAGLFGKIERLMPRLVEALQEKGYQAEAEALQQEVEARLAEVPPERRQPPGARPAAWPSMARPAMARRELPARCSACGAPVKPDDVTWLDPQSAECPYCGSVLKAT